MRIKTTGPQGQTLLDPRDIGEGPPAFPITGSGRSVLEKLGSELCLASLGGGAAFQEAAAEKKLQAFLLLE